MSEKKMTLEIVSVKVELASNPTEDCENIMARGLEDNPIDYVLIVGLNENVLLDGASMSLIGCKGTCEVIEMQAESFDRRADRLYEAEFRIRNRHEEGTYKVKLNAAETDCKTAELNVCITKNSEEVEKKSDCG